ncbi:MAG: prenyltransferase/squalene oxidase repeat-containing protein [Opitutaceae bacterium]|nr:prenyltransferase/squalene oxidase repeat-containing protein [Opitutaceae bacterium]
MMFDEPLRTRIARARDTAVAALLSERNGAGHWSGELSASALSTATAVTALTLVARADPGAAEKLRAPLRRGFAWLARNQNADGGWGDTTRSKSNISTTTLVWAALGLGEKTDDEIPAATAAAERWLTRAAGSLEPAALVAAIERRYGDDRTFSIPILTMCALCGRLGAGTDGWRHVRQLPFELAALPQRWFGALQLPVVSYALPALIAIGQVRHGLRPTRNPLLRVLRERCSDRTLAKLAQLQPPNGGFLEATPLTSFVTMSLAGLGLTAHPVVRRGVFFLESSQRPDGSWPIDTNLATWVTTLSINALAPSALPHEAIAPLQPWLLGQQYRSAHPYTLAAPGGWAWTDLPGGVPDADDTAGAILALLQLAPGDAPDAGSADAVRAGIGWLIDLQNRDGGIPTFCRGWGKLPFDRSSPDITAHAIRAWVAARPHVVSSLQVRLDRALARAVIFLEKTQRPDGAWVPLWFGHQDDPADENPLYGTARVIAALCALESAGHVGVRAALDRALHWIVSRQNPDGGWSGAVGASSSLEETGVALEALAHAHRRAHSPSPGGAAFAAALARGATWLCAAIEQDQWRTPAPIGFYFAKLWYFEKLYPLIFATGALTRLAKLR